VNYNFATGKVILFQMRTELISFGSILNFWWIRSLKTACSSVSTGENPGKELIINTIKNIMMSARQSKGGKGSPCD
jgi:hypothetical protein